MKEIERKFLVKSEDYKHESRSSAYIAQGYLNSDPERTVRIRIKGNKGFLTIKGPGNSSGLTRTEWESEIPAGEAKVLLELCEPGIIEKIRHEVPCGSHLFEVDEFLGENQGLTIAEIELQSEDEDFIKPQWIGPEVSGEARYYNSQLSKRPFNTW